MAREQGDACVKALKHMANEEAHDGGERRADNRFIPGLDVTLTVLDNNGEQLGKHRQPFLWHPWLYRYGLNWRVPGDGKYTLQVQIKAP